MSMDTNAWGQLLEGTATGPWEWYWDHGILSVRSSDGVPVATDMDVQDSDLIAAAPAAVAEVVRLRRELEQLRDDLGQANYGGQDDVSWYLQGQVAEAERVGRQITHILEGTNE